MPLSRDGGLQALPAELAASLAQPLQKLAKRERTRRQLFAAATAVLTERGVAAATLQQIADQAEVTIATVYNHFTSREALFQEVALWVADTLCRRISDSCIAVPDGSERMAIGNRRYLWLAEQSPRWAVLLLDLAAASPALAGTTRGYVEADLRLGIAQKAFKVVSIDAALDMVAGTIGQAMRSWAHGLAPAGHSEAVTTTVLVGLGMDRKDAQAIVRRRLPPLPAGAG
jgi:AcrR family transcriptional regulator